MFVGEQLEFIKNTVKNLIKISNKYNGTDCRPAILFFWIFTEQKLLHQAQGGGWKWKERVVGILCSLAWEGLSPAFSPQPCVKCFSTRPDQKKRMSSNAGCYITQLDFSHSLIHFSAYLYPFKSRDLTTPPPSQAGTQTRQMNNRRKDAARLLRENKWRCTWCVEDFSEWDLDQSSTCCWHTVEGRKIKESRVVITLKRQ